MEKRCRLCGIKSENLIGEKCELCQTIVNSELAYCTNRIFDEIKKHRKAHADARMAESELRDHDTDEILTHLAAIEKKLKVSEEDHVKTHAYLQSSSDNISDFVRRLKAIEKKLDKISEIIHFHHENES